MVLFVADAQTQYQAGPDAFFGMAGVTFALIFSSLK
jgi:hypothetical protein